MLEDFDVKVVLKKRTTVSEFIPINVKGNNGPPFSVSTTYNNRKIKSSFQTEFEEFITDPLLVGKTQHFVCGNLNSDLMKANSMSQSLGNLIACSDITLKLRKPLRG